MLDGWEERAYALISILPLVFNDTTMHIDVNIGATNIDITLESV